jgi:eukaryotic-like serine/threonine-protein kinase
MTPAEEQVECCDLCGTPLSLSSGAPGCLRCLLAGGRNGAEERRYQHYEVMLREDGITPAELGRGAMGITYRALDLNLGAPVALKVISARYSNQRVARDRFRREAQTAAQLRHPNVASVYHFGETAAGQCFYAMELVEGETLEARVRREGPLGAEVGLEIAIQVAHALLAAEKHGLVHRDLKPSNLMLVPNESGNERAPSVKVIDFGLAKAVTSPGEASEANETEFAGTPGFASPEQFQGNGRKLDTRSDIYSLGTTLWYALTEEIPSAGESLPLERLVAREVPAPMIRLLRRARALDPAERPESARVFLTELELCQAAIRAAPWHACAPRTRWPILLAALAVLTLAATALLFWRAHVLDQRHARGERLAFAISNKSIAVLPFANLSHDPENAFFTDGIKDQILTRLSKIAALKVISRTSTQKFKSAPENLPEIAQQLGVANILEGSVQKAGETVRVTVQLIRAQSDTHLWAETYDRKLTDVFEVESEVAQRIATALAMRLSGSEQQALTAKPTTNVEAYQAYLKGRYFWNKRTGEGFTKAGESFGRAIAIDPNYAPAYAGLSDVYQFRATLDTISRAQDYVKARDAARKALELDETLAEPHASLGLIAMNYDWDWASAEKEFRQAIELNPNYATAHHWYAEYLVAVGRFDESLVEINRARELDPLSLIINTDMGKVLYYSRRYDEAIAQLQETLRMDPSFHDAHLWLGSVYAKRGLYPEAIGEFKKISDSPWALGWLGYVYGVSGRRDEAEKVVNQIESKGPIDPSVIVYVYIGLGEENAAFAAFEKEYELRSVGMTSLKVNPWYDSLRSDPRFADLLRRTNLTPP